MSTTLKLESPWEEVKEKLKEIDHSISDEDLRYAPGEENALLERLSKKLGRSTGEVKTWIESVSFNKGKAS
ncbi:MAG TPA: hypothetical protein VHL77_06140 [Ferruginibacter sp.]|jgi:hypothetical protein|nr:hypothetical protein [Ferruginibacter sp.]